MRGNLWELMGTSCVRTYENLWELIAWEFIETHGNLWELMGTYGNLWGIWNLRAWELMGAYGNLRELYAWKTYVVSKFFSQNVCCFIIIEPKCMSKQ